jgi:uncharacterized caspase-like protein
MSRLLSLLLAGLAAALLSVASPDASAAAPSERRLALVIGNGAYRHTAPLPNPVKDAEAMASALTGLGFEVIVGMDLDHVAFGRRMQDFARRAEQADVALFYYAGHGMQVNGENYLVPVDAALKREADLEFETVRVDQVLRQMQRASGPKIALLDACRDNPLATQLSRQLGGRTRAVVLSSGMSEIAVQNVTGTMVAFATAPGSVALDGENGRSPFTAALLKHMDTPGLDIDLVMKRVRGEVAEKTNQRQQPWTNSSLTREFYLRPPQRSAEPAAAPAQAAVAVAALNAAAAPALAQPQLPPPSDILAQVELERWRAAEKSGKREDYEEYLRHHANGAFAETAKRRLADLPAGASPTAAAVAALAPVAAATTAKAVSAPAPAVAPKATAERPSRARREAERRAARAAARAAAAEEEARPRTRRAAPAREARRAEPRQRVTRRARDDDDGPTAYEPGARPARSYAGPTDDRPSSFWQANQHQREQGRAVPRRRVVHEEREGPPLRRDNGAGAAIIGGAALIGAGALIGGALGRR